MEIIGNIGRGACSCSVLGLHLGRHHRCCASPTALVPYPPPTPSDLHKSLPRPTSPTLTPALTETSAQRHYAAVR